MDKIQKLIPHTILDLQKFVVADAGNSVSAVVEGNVQNAYFVHFEYGRKGAQFKCRTCFLNQNVVHENDTKEIKWTMGRYRY